MDNRVYGLRRPSVGSSAAVVVVDAGLYLACGDGVYAVQVPDDGLCRDDVVFSSRCG